MVWPGSDVSELFEAEGEALAQQLLGRLTKVGQHGMGLRASKEPKAEDEEVGAGRPQRALPALEHLP